MNGKQLQFAQGAYRFKPDGSDFEFLTGSTNNTWGLGFSETFDVFGSTANNDPSWYLAIPNRYFEGVRGCRRPAGRGVRPGLPEPGAVLRGALRSRRTSGRSTCSGGYTAARRPSPLHGARFPKEYWNRIAFITEPTAHLVGQAIIEKPGRRLRDARRLEPDGRRRGVVRAGRTRRSGPTARCGWPTGTTSSPSTTRRRPGFSTGTGNAYETSMRDHQRGRIYRIVVQGRAAGAEAVAVEDDTAGLLDGARVRQHVLAAARAAPARRARPEGRRAAAHRARAEHVRGRDRHERRRAARAVDAAGSWRAGPRPRRGVSRRRRRR